MLGRLGLVPLFAVSLAACEPKKEEPALDGAPELDGGPKATPDAPGELAGGEKAQQIILPGVMNIVAPIDTHVINSCEKIVAVDYNQPPVMACVFFLRDGAMPAPDGSEFDRVLDYQMATAGWVQVGATGAQHYFEYAKPGTDCADVSVFTALDASQLDRLVKEAKAAAAPKGKSWQGYAVPATVREACGADRMKRQAR